MYITLDVTMSFIRIKHEHDLEYWLRRSKAGIIVGLLSGTGQRAGLSYRQWKRDGT